MPFIQVTILQGRTVEQKHELIKLLTDAAEQALGGDRGRIRVALYEVTGDDWGIGGEPVTNIRSVP
jgi:4-oxalocrotonate tautomerase